MTVFLFRPLTTRLGPLRLITTAKLRTQSDPEAQATLDSGAKCEAIRQLSEMVPQATCFSAQTSTVIVAIEKLLLPTVLTMGCCK